MGNTTELLNLSGFVQTTISTDGEGPSSIALVLSDGTECPILHKGAGVDLVDHIGADVEIVACWEAEPVVEGGKALRVRSYTVTDGYEDPWYDDDE